MSKAGLNTAQKHEVCIAVYVHWNGQTINYVLNRDQNTLNRDILFIMSKAKFIRKAEKLEKKMSSEEFAIIDEEKFYVYGLYIPFNEKSPLLKEIVKRPCN